MDHNDKSTGSALGSAASKPETDAPESGLRVWWIPQVPMTPFYHPVANPEQARLLLEVLAKYDLFQFENNVKPDYCNAGGLETFEDGEWVEWSDPTTGEDINEWHGGL